MARLGRRKKPSWHLFSTAFENAVSESLHFQAVGRLKMAGRPAPHGKRYSIGAFLSISRWLDPRHRSDLLAVTEAKTEIDK
jgi:hypothetical protein